MNKNKCICMRASVYVWQVQQAKWNKMTGVNDDTSWNESLEDGNVSLNILLFVVINF